MHAVEAIDLEKVYRRPFGKATAALDGVTLSVPRGSVFGLIGLNGAGKTTFIKTILAVVRPSAGTIRVLGGSPEDASVRARIGYLPERSYHPPTATALSFLASIARLKRLRPGADDLVRLLERVGLAASARGRVSQFSKGMKQRLGLAAALIGAPELLLLDEPTDGIDPLGRIEVRRILLEERDRGATILLNSHLLAETERIADRVAIIHSGKVVREGTLEELSRVSPSWRVRFSSAPDGAALAAAGFVESGDGAYRVEAADAAALNIALDRARTSGALIIEVLREGKNLEHVLEQLVAPSPENAEAA